MECGAVSISGEGGMYGICANPVLWGIWEDTDFNKIKYACQGSQENSTVYEMKSQRGIR